MLNDEDVRGAVSRKLSPLKGDDEIHSVGSA